MEQTLPQQMVFSCEAGSFSIFDKEEARGFVRTGSGTPFLTLRVGPSNIFESAPQRVLLQTHSHISVQCVDGVVVRLDFDEETATKETLQGKFVYRGGIEDGNKGRGYMKA